MYVHLYLYLIACVRVFMYIYVRSIYMIVHTCVRVYAYFCVIFVFLLFLIDAAEIPECVFE